jgi:hypothetical protein
MPIPHVYETITEIDTETYPKYCLVVLEDGTVIGYPRYCFDRVAYWKVGTDKILLDLEHWQKSSGNSVPCAIMVRDSDWHHLGRMEDRHNWFVRSPVLGNPPFSRPP